MCVCASMFLFPVLVFLFAFKMLEAAKICLQGPVGPH